MNPILPRPMQFTLEHESKSAAAVRFLWRYMMDAEPMQIPKGSTAFRRLRKWRRGRRKLYRIEADARRMVMRERV